MLSQSILTQISFLVLKCANLGSSAELEASAQGQQLSYDVDFSNHNANGRYGDSRLGYENPGLDTFAPEAPNSLSHGDVHVNMAGGYDNSAFLNGGPVRVSAMDVFGFE